MAKTLTESQKLRYCDGCKDDFYNGKNPMGITKCWALEGAQLVLKKLVHIDQRPPWKQKPVKVLDCYRKPRHVKVDPKVER